MWHGGLTPIIEQVKAGFTTGVTFVLLQFLTLRDWWRKLNPILAI